MTHLPFIQQSCGDVLAETAHLSTEEFGAYQLLSFAFWQHGALPDDDGRLARLARATPERWAVIRPVISDLFGAGWKPERLAKRRDEVEALHLRKSEGGKRGARKRWDSDNSPNGTPIGSANNSLNRTAYSNHNHNHKTPAYEKEAPTHAYAREIDSFIPAPHSRDDALALLNGKGVFPGDFDVMLPKLLRGELLRSELEAAA